MPLADGTRLGAYEILSLLGAGGMGEVYRARDTKLRRDVALKVLPESFTRDAARIARFRREAQVLASLNHPHIGAIYGLDEANDTQFLVLELVDGRTLADRIAKGPLPLVETLAIARQMTEALEAAHDQGIVHLDLKPANVVLTRDGHVKVLDFGLAKAIDPGTTPLDVTNSPTLTSPAMLTGVGVILGTAAYMSPEQAKGQETDCTADLWAFGCVVYEMLTARRAFDGQTVTEALANVLKTEPDWQRLPVETPEGIRRLLRRCLRKEPALRLRDMRDARLEIDEAQSGSPTDAPEVRASSRGGERLAWSLAMGLVTLIAAVLAVRASRPLTPAAETRLDITTPPTTDLTSLAISPDGQKVVFAATSGARSQLWLRSLDSASARPLEGTETASFPFWSPDSRSIGFFADAELKRIDIAGGSAVVLANAPYGRGGAWSGDGAMLFVPNPGSPILKISATGGKSIAVTQVAMPQQQHQSPQFLPDGRHFLYYVLGAADAGGVYVGDLGGSKATRILAADAAAVYAPSGHLLFVRRGTLFAQNFDPARLALGGSPFPVAEQVAVEASFAALSASGTGPLVYRTGSTDRQQQLTWLDLSGKETGTVGEPVNAPSTPSLSPDGRRVAAQRGVGGNIDIYLLETARAGLNRFTVDAADDIFPVWSPDGGRIVFSSTRKRGLDLYLKSASGTGNDELLLETPQIKAATSWSQDGRFLLYSSADPTTGFDIWALPMNGERKPFSVIQTKSNERLAQFSPDGRWIAYESDESGRYEIYLQPWSDSRGNAGGKVPISTAGGAQVRWRHDGKALFYIALDDRLMMVPIRFASNGQAAEPGAPVPLFATRVGGAVQVFPRYRYSVSADDRQFLMDLEREGVAASPITVLINWAGQHK